MLLYVRWCGLVWPLWCVCVGVSERVARCVCLMAMAGEADTPLHWPVRLLLSG